jgi:hypothetical protein
VSACVICGESAHIRNGYELKACSAYNREWRPVCGEHGNDVIANDVEANGGNFGDLLWATICYPDEPPMDKETLANLCGPLERPCREGPGR